MYVDVWYYGSRDTKVTTVSAWWSLMVWRLNSGMASENFMMNTRSIGLCQEYQGDIGCSELDWWYAVPRLAVW